MTRSTSSPSVAAGLRFVFDAGRGDSAVPVRSTTFGVGLAVAALIATLVVAIPAGVFAGRLLWSLTAHWLGIAVYNVVPVGTIVAVAAAALVAGNAAALVPAAAAARISAAESLRRE